MFRLKGSNKLAIIYQIKVLQSTNIVHILRPKGNKQKALHVILKLNHTFICNYRRGDE